MGVNKICRSCGKPFTVIKSRAKTAYTCSRECKYALHPKSNSVECSCQRCGTKFMTPVSRVKRGNGRYCSTECFNEARRTDECLEQRAMAIRGELNPQWKGGLSRHSDGYFYQHSPGHPLASNGYVFQHRLVMEEKMRSEAPDHPFLAEGFLSGKICVHHRDGDRTNNDPANLMAMIPEAHTRWHNSGTLPEPWECWPKVHPSR